jgi:hypothetical protein
MGTIESILISVVASAIILAPKAIDVWLSGRETARARQAESLGAVGVGGAE